MKMARAIIKNGRMVKDWNDHSQSKKILEMISWAVLLVVGFHVLVLVVMMLGIMFQPQVVQHTGYWDGLLRLIIR